MEYLGIALRIFVVCTCLVAWFDEEGGVEMGFLKVCGMIVELLKKTKALDYLEHGKVGLIQPIISGFLAY